MRVASTAAGLLVGLALLAAGGTVAAQALPRIPNPETLAIEMAKALVAGDRQRCTALAATREEMEKLLEASQPLAGQEQRQDLRNRVAEILADLRGDFDRFQAMKRAAGVKDGAAVRFEPIELDRIFEKDGMKKVRHSRVRMFHSLGGGNEESFVISLDDMFLFPRGWAFTSVAPGIARETRP